MTSKGQVTISSKARKALGLDKGDCLIELVVGNCIVLLPESQILTETEETIQETARQREIRVAERYPRL